MIHSKGQTVCSHVDSGVAQRIWHNFDVVFAVAALYSIGPLEDMNIISIECVPQVFSVFLGYKVCILRLVDSFFVVID